MPRVTKLQRRSQRIEAFGLCAAALTALCAPVVQGWAGHDIPPLSLALTVVWAGSLAVLAKLRLSGAAVWNGRMDLFVALSTPMFGAAIAHGNRLPAFEIFVFLAPLPLLYSVFVRERVTVAVTGALATWMTGVGICWTEAMVLPQATRAMFFLTLTSGFGVYGSFIFRRVQLLQRSLMAQRELAERKETDEAVGRADLERRSIESERMATVGRLAAGVAHDVNNPLAFVRSNIAYVREELGALKSGALTADVIDAIDEALSGVKRIQAIVGDLKSLSREDMEDECTSATDAVEEAIRLASASLPADVTVKAPSAAGPLPVSIGRGRLVQVVVNLLINAGDALAAHRGGTVKVSIAHTNSRVEIRIEDDGPGIPGDVLSRLFQPFVTTKPVGKGTGLGLWLSRQYVEHRGGSLRASNRPEGGARFVIDLEPAKVDVAPLKVFSASAAARAAHEELPN